MREIGFFGWLLSIAMIVVLMVLSKWFYCLDDIVQIFVYLMWMFWVVMVIGMFLPLLA